MTKENTGLQEIIIDSNCVQKEYLKDIFRYRELLYFMAWRDIIVRYKQTALGVIWAAFRPLITMAVFAFVFGRVANLARDNVNYPLFVLSGLLPWLFFSASLIDTSATLINNVHMISKIYFPRMVLPISNIIVHFVDFSISLVLLFIFLLFSGNLNHWTLLLIPFFIVQTFSLCLGTGLWLSAIMVRYRDFRFIIPFLVQVGIFISPVGYSSFLMSEKLQFIYFLNPMVGIIEGFRWCCLGNYHQNLFFAIAISCIVNLAILVSGFRYFRKMERICADII